MFFTIPQFMLIAALAFAYVVSGILAARAKASIVRHVSTFLGCCTFVVGAILAAKNFLFLLTTTEPIHGRWGKTLAHEFVIKPSDDPLIYLFGLVLQAGTVLLCLVLAYSVYSHRFADEG